ncbi:hypothetical protein ACOMHN_017453 [Nucella lapillus]
MGRTVSVYCGVYEHHGSCHVSQERMLVWQAHVTCDKSGCWCGRLVSRVTRADVGVAGSCHVSQERMLVWQAPVASSAGNATCGFHVMRLGTPGMCGVHLRAPAGTVLRIRLCVCNNVILEIRAYLHGNRIHPHRPVFPCGPKQQKDVYTMSNAVSLFVSVRDLNICGFICQVGTIPTLNFDFAAVSVEEQTSFKVTYFSPSMGYLLPSHNLELLASFYACVTLSVPRGHVTLVSRLQPMIWGHVSLFTGPCARRTSGARRMVSPVVLYPDRSTAPDGASPGGQDQGLATLSLSYTLVTSFNLLEVFLDKFHVVFSFHGNLSKPYQVKDQWNCSVVWPGLYRHFPCDLRPQCMEGEEESACPYAWKARGTHVVWQMSGCTPCAGLEFRAHRRACGRLGMAPVSPVFPREWPDLAAATWHHGNPSIWLNLHPTRALVPRSPNHYIRNMYFHTWQWGGGGVAYFLHYTLQPNGPSQPAMMSPRAVRSMPQDTFTHTFKDNTHQWVPTPSC